MTQVILSGAGIHTGCTAQVGITMTDRGGIVFHTPTGTVPCGASFIDPTGSRCTKLTHLGATVQTVEHLMAALIHYCPNAIVAVDGPEIPVLDGSSAPIVAALANVHPRTPPPLLPCTLHTELKEGQSTATIHACGAEPPIYRVVLDYLEPVGPLSFTYSPTGDHFADDLAPARTFALQTEVQRMQDAGLARGGSLENAVVIGKQGPLNPEGLRFPDEPARHKMLDMVGDLALLGGLPNAHITVTRPGHAINHAIVRMLST